MQRFAIPVVSLGNDRPQMRQELALRGGEIHRRQLGQDLEAVLVGRVALQPPPGVLHARAQLHPVCLGEGAALLLRRDLLHGHGRHLHQVRDLGKAHPVRLRLLAVRPREVEGARVVAQEVRFGGRLRLHLAEVGRGGAVVLVIERRHGLPRRVEVDLLAVMRPHHEEARELGPEDLHELSGRHADPLARAHLAPPHEEPLVGDRDRRPAAEDALAHHGGNVMAAALRHVIFAGALDGDAEDPPLGGPFRLVLQLAAAVQGRPPAVLPAAPRPDDLVGPALVGNERPVPAGHDRRADPPARLAQGLDGMALGLLAAADLPVDLDQLIGAVEGDPDRVVEPAGLVHLARPVDLRLRADLRPHLGEPEPEVPRITGASADGRRDLGQRHAQIPVELGRHACRAGIHRIVVIEPVQERRLPPPGLQPACHAVVQHDTPQRPDVDRPRGALRVVHDVAIGRTGGEDVLDDNVYPHGGLRVIPGFVSPSDRSCAACRALPRRERTTR